MRKTSPLLHRDALAFAETNEQDSGSAVEFGVKLPSVT